MIRSQLRMHAFAGRENGLMIFGTRDELRQFATDLINSLEQDSSPPAPDWPAMLIAIDAPSPYSGQDFEVSFHLQTQPLPAALLTPIRRGPSVFVYLAFALLTLLGLASVPMWARQLLDSSSCSSELHKCDTPPR